MERLIQRFGAAVQQVCRRDPIAARRLLRLGYHAKDLQLRFAPGQLHRAAQLAAVETTSAMVAPLDHPDKAVMVSLFTPCEMLQVLGLYPYSCEGLGCFLSGAWAERSFLEYAESEGLPETFCSYHKIFIGAAERGLMPRPRFVISTTLACDANLLTFRRLAEFYQVPHLVLDIPYGQDEDAVAYVAEQLRGMRRFLEEHTGRRVDEDALRAAVARSRRSMDGFRRYMDLRADKQILGDLTGEMFSAFTLHTLLGHGGDGSGMSRPVSSWRRRRLPPPGHGWCGCTPSPSGSSPFGTSPTSARRCRWWAATCVSKGSSRPIPPTPIPPWHSAWSSPPSMAR